MKKIIALFILLFTIFVMVGCTVEEGQAPTISVDSYNLEVDLDGNEVLNPVASGFEGTPLFEYTSTDPSVFTVDNGVISPVKAGEGKVIIRLSETNVEIEVNVKIVETNELVLRIANEDLTIEVEETLQLHLLVNETNYNEEVTWESSNSNVATVDEFGLVSAREVGSTTITATVNDQSISVEIVVEEKVLEALSISGPEVTYINEAVPLTAKYGNNNTNVFWEIDNQSFALILQNGIIIASKVGKVTITATLINDPSIRVSKTITILGYPPLTVTSSVGTEINKGAYGARLVVNGSNGLPIKLSDCQFTSSSDSVVTIDDDGKINTISEGTATITVKNGNSVGTITLTILPAPEENKRNQILSLAIAEDGYHEGSNNDNKFGIWYGMNYQPWCAIFVSWAAYQAGVGTNIIPKYAAVQYGLDWYRNKGSEFYKTYQESIDEVYTPIAGDIVFFKSNGASHTALVIKVVGDIMYTIEGNTSDSVRMRYYYYKNYNKITGYGLPAYPESSTPIYDFDVSAASFGGGVSTT